MKGERFVSTETKGLDWVLLREVLDLTISRRQGRNTLKRAGEFITDVLFIWAWLESFLKLFPT